MKAIIAGASGHIGKQLFTQAQSFFETFCTLTSIPVRDGALLPLKLDAPERFDYGLI